MENRNDFYFQIPGFPLSGVNFRLRPSLSVPVLGEIWNVGDVIGFRTSKEVGQEATGTNCIAAYPEAWVHHKGYYTELTGRLKNSSARPQIFLKGLSREWDVAIRCILLCRSLTIWLVRICGTDEE